MPLVFTLQEFIEKSLKEIAPEIHTDKVVLEPTKDISHGDLASNAAMVCAKAVGISPRELAVKLIEKITTHDAVVSAEIAGPGFINIKLKPSALQNELNQILASKSTYGSNTLGAGKSAQVEYVSTNPTGPMHIGHGRNAILGDTVSSLLEKVGYCVTREYYVNDAGGQTIALARSAYVRYKEALDEPISDDDFDQDMYKGDYLKPVGVALAQKYGNSFLNRPEAEWFETVRLFAIEEMMNYIRHDLKSLGITMEYASESALTKEGWVTKALKVLEAKGDVYTGVLEKPKGHQVDDWEERPQTLFRATAFGDEIDRALQKSDGAWTYFAGDVGYHYHKISRNYDVLVNILGFDHVGYVKRLVSAVKALKADQSYAVKTCQMVNFSDNGQPVRMSKRAGTFVTIQQLVERVGKDAVRFMMISRHQDMVIDFDFKKAVEQSKDNPLFYIQYAHARIHSVLRHATQIFNGLPKTESLECLNDEAELTLIKGLIQWPRVVTSAAHHLEPHRVTNYLYDLASLFHSLWNKGKDNTQLRFIDEKSPAQTAARLVLLQATVCIIAEGLNLLGITPVEEMR
jgi:arginyl-tRNA synthetase